MIETFKMKIILICIKDTTVALKMQKNARNNEIDLIKKIIIMKLFDCFYESRMKRTTTRKTTETVIDVKRKNTFQKIVSNLSRIIFKLIL